MFSVSVHASSCLNFLKGGYIVGDDSRELCRGY